MGPCVIAGVVCSRFSLDNAVRCAVTSFGRAPTPELAICSHWNVFLARWCSDSSSPMTSRLAPLVVVHPEVEYGSTAVPVGKVHLMLTLLTDLAQFDRRAGDLGTC
eukprot:6468377-Amphidinium_carterae.1